jgi:DNA-binding NarL/FixJ family response regulator
MTMPSRQGCRLLLQHAGFEIAGEAASGEEAYASCLKHPPRVVIVDLAGPLPAHDARGGFGRPACARSNAGLMPDDTGATPRAIVGLRVISPNAPRPMEDLIQT